MVGHGSFLVVQLIPRPASTSWPSLNSKETVFMSDESDSRESRNYQARVQTFIDRLAFLIAKRWIREQQQGGTGQLNDQPTTPDDAS